MKAKIKTYDSGYVYLRIVKFWIFREAYFSMSVDCGGVVVSMRTAKGGCTIDICCLQEFKRQTSDVGDRP